MAREYPEDLINKAFDKARKIPRKVALLQIQKRVTEHMQVFLKDTWNLWPPAEAQTS